MSSLNAKRRDGEEEEVRLASDVREDERDDARHHDAERDRQDPVDTLAGRPRRRVSADHRERGLRERELTREAEHEVEADDEDAQIDPLVEVDGLVVVPRRDEAQRDHEHDEDGEPRVRETRAWRAGAPTVEFALHSWRWR